MGLVMKIIINGGDFGISISLNRPVVMLGISAIVREKIRYVRSSEAVSLKEFSGCVRLQRRGLPMP